MQNQSNTIVYKYNTHYIEVCLASANYCTLLRRSVMYLHRSVKLNTMQCFFDKCALFTCQDLWSQTLMLVLRSFLFLACRLGHLCHFAQQKGIEHIAKQLFGELAHWLTSVTEKTETSVTRSTTSKATRSAAR